MAGDDEEVDIDPALRRYVTEACARLDTIDHYTLLEVPRTAKERDIKRAYLRLVGRLHPDRFFRKRLGSYKVPLQRLFTGITAAHDVLTKPELRAEYDEELSRRSPSDAPDGAPGGSSSPLPPSPVAPAAPPPPAAAPARDHPAARKAAMDALAARFADAKAQARQFAETAGRARAAGDLVAAAEAYRNALSRTPGDPTLTAALAEVERGAAERVAESRRKQALLEERYGHWVEAAGSWQRVLDAFPADDEARRHLAGALERARAGR